MNEAALELEGVSHRYGAMQALRDVSVRIAPKSCTALIGPNGAGKTTALSLWSGFLRASRGAVRVAGHAPDASRGVLAALPQDAALPAAPSVGMALELLARLSGEEAPTEAARAALARVGLSEVWGRRPGALSHGMAKRVALAQILFGRPRVVLLDEPTAGLDPRAAADVRALISELRTERTVVVSSHQLAELEALCDHVLVLEQGRVAFFGPMHELTAARAELRIEIARGSVPLAALRAVRGVREAQLGVTGTLVIRHEVHDIPEDLTNAVLRVLLEAGVHIRSLVPGQSLEAGVLGLGKS